MARHSKTGVRGLYREEDGRFRFDLRWREPKTGLIRRYAERFPDGLKAGAAKTRAQGMVELALAGGWNPRQEAAKHLDDAVAEYLKWSALNRPKTLRNRKSLTGLIQAALGNPALTDVGAFAVERLKQARDKAGAGPATINRTVAVLKHLMALAAKWGWVPKAAAMAVRDVELLDEPPGRVRYLDDGERSRLLAALEAPGRERLRLVVLAALNTGMRKGELLGLRRSAVNLEAQEITLTVTKTNKLRRIPINGELAEVLKTALAQSPRECEFVFTTARGKPHNPSTFWGAFDRVRKEAKVEDFRFHDNRHDFATSLHDNGVDLYVVQTLLGHEGPAMTQRYTHGKSERHRRAVATLDNRGRIPAPLPPEPSNETGKPNEARALRAV